MTIQDIAIQRLANQGVGAKATTLEVARRMGAMQSQDYNGMLWAFGARTGMNEAELVRDLKEREVIRTWPQRGTLHAIPSADAKWMVAISADRLIKGAKRRREQLGLDDATLASSQATLKAALAGDKLMSRPKVMKLLEDAGISTASGRGYHILWYLAQTGVIYIGPAEAKQQTIGLLDDLVPSAKRLERGEAIAEMARRYFTSHGPATIQDFIWWTGLTSADAKAGLEAVRPLLDEVSVDGTTYWTPKQAANVTRHTYLLTGFDEFMLGYRDRSAALPGEHAQKIIPGGNGMFLSTIVIQGQVVGTWKRTVKKDRVIIELQPFSTITKTDLAELQEPAEAYGRFHGLPADVRTV